MRQPVLIDPAGWVHFFYSTSEPFGEFFKLSFGWSRFVRICAERFDGIDAVVDKMPPTGKCDPCIAGGDHASACVSGENDHSYPEDDHRPAGKSMTLF